MIIGACFLGVIGFMLHAMMGSREHCASLDHLKIQKISLNELKRFIKKDIYYTNKYFAGLHKGHRSGQLLRLCSSIREQKC
jgi:hypothetical protein